jgi:hypothetical protein
VRRHEQAHKAAGGRYAGAISYEYSRGPDGKRYAVGGEVGIDISPERDPAATIAKMRQVKAAALAPADPSAQDRAVAAEAGQIEQRARRELRLAATESASAFPGAGRGENGSQKAPDNSGRPSDWNGPAQAEATGPAASRSGSPGIRDSAVSRISIRRMSGGINLLA